MDELKKNWKIATRGEKIKFCFVMLLQFGAGSYAIINALLLSYYILDNNNGMLPHYLGLTILGYALLFVTNRIKVTPKARSKNVH
jgi:hypothetical protein